MIRWKTVSSHEENSFGQSSWGKPFHGKFHTMLPNVGVRGGKKSNCCKIVEFFVIIRQKNRKNILNGF